MLDSTDHHVADEPSEEGRFWTHDRGFGIQIDFLIGSSVYMTAWITFLALSVSVLGGLAPPPTDDKVAAERAADRLTDDLLATAPLEPDLNRTCTQAFFEENAAGGCGFDSSWGAGTQEYLNDALSLQGKNINVTIRGAGGNVQSISGTDLQTGDRVPANTKEVHGWTRQAALDYDDDGSLDWVIVEVRVWS